MTAGPNLHPRSGEELARWTREADAFSVQHEAARRAEYDAYRQMNAEAAARSSQIADPGAQRAIANIGRNSTRNTAIAGALFIGGYLAIPTVRGRRLYLLTTAFTMGGFFAMDTSGPVHPEGAFIDADVTVLSVLLWAVGFYCLIQLIREIRAIRRWARR